jgi:predicted ABC-class ATPase
VVGGAGDYFSIADNVIGMKDYLPEDLTQTARDIAEKSSTRRKNEGGDCFGFVTERIPVRESIDPSRGRRSVKIAAKGIHTIDFGASSIDLSDLEQLVDIGQTRAIGDAIQYSTRYMGGRQTLAEIAGRIITDIKEKGFDILDCIPSGEYAGFRKYELIGAINRLRSIHMEQKAPDSHS